MKAYQMYDLHEYLLHPTSILLHIEDGLEGLLEVEDIIELPGAFLLWFVARFPPKFSVGGIETHSGTDSVEEIFVRDVCAELNVPGRLRIDRDADNDST